jgi:hypothetical protein
MQWLADAPKQPVLSMGCGTRNDLKATEKQKEKKKKSFTEDEETRVYRTGRSGKSNGNRQAQNKIEAYFQTRHKSGDSSTLGVGRRKHCERVYRRARKG